MTQQIKELAAKPEPPLHPEFDTQHFHMAKSCPLTSTHVLCHGRWGVLSLSCNTFLNEKEGYLAVFQSNCS